MHGCMNCGDANCDCGAESSEWCTKCTPCVEEALDDDFDDDWTIDDDDNAFSAPLVTLDNFDDDGSDENG